MDVLTGEWHRPPYGPLGIMGLKLWGCRAGTDLGHYYIAGPSFGGP